MSAGRLRRRELAASLAVLAAGGLAARLLRELPSGAQKLEMSPVIRAVLDDPGSPATGPADADVTLVVFSDYRCPICRTSEPALVAVLARDPRLRVIYKDWPIFGEASRVSARIALAANLQGRYRAMHDVLMSGPANLDDAGLAAAAAQAGVDRTRLQDDLAAHAAEFDAQLARHAGEAWSLGIEGTPAWLVGLRLYKGAMSEAALAGAVAKARKDLS